MRNRQRWRDELWHTGQRSIPALEHAWTLRREFALVMCKLPPSPNRARPRAGAASANEGSLRKSNKLIILPGEEITNQQLHARRDSRLLVCQFGEHTPARIRKLALCFSFGYTESQTGSKLLPCWFFLQARTKLYSACREPRLPPRQSGRRWRWKQILNVFFYPHFTSAHTK